MSLFDDLRDEVALMLLFLKSVRVIEVMELRPGQREPSLLFSCGVRDCHNNAQLLAQRALFTEAVSAPPERPVASTYRLDMCTRCACVCVFV